MEGVDGLALVSRWLHITAAMFAVGGAVLMRTSLFPASQEVLDEPTRKELHATVTRRWKIVVHVAVTVLLLTGAFNFYWLALKAKISPNPYHFIFGAKLILALFVISVTEILIGRSPGTAPMRKNATVWLTRLIIAAALVVFVSGLLHAIRTA
ncbi:MAG: hypothetical protein C4547_08700 [Phycisphaerales bacterium]|nr:MAG: hypothetical protein C4547_08700 [Phycisphaerales bacterium]